SLMDFGIARHLDGTQLTQTGWQLGTPAYMAPEQWLGQRIGPAADIYALGVVTYRLLAGSLPFDGKEQAFLAASAGSPAPYLEDRRPGLPNHVYASVNRALALLPKDRHPSAAAFVTALTRPSAAVVTTTDG